MRTQHFVKQLDHAAIVGAIKNAEANTSGQIRVFIQRGEMSADPVDAAQRRFAKLGMEKTAERNAILVFVAPRARKFAVIGDEGVHARCGVAFWERLVAKMRSHFQNESFTEALVEAINEAGKVLAQHFPRTGPARNELPDTVIES